MNIIYVVTDANWEHTPYTFNDRVYALEQVEKLEEKYAPMEFWIEEIDFN